MGESPYCRNADLGRVDIPRSRSDQILLLLVTLRKKKTLGRMQRRLKIDGGTASNTYCHDATKCTTDRKLIFPMPKQEFWTLHDSQQGYAASRQDLSCLRVERSDARFLLGKSPS
jgi:hypothetical protein